MRTRGESGEWMKEKRSSIRFLSSSFSFEFRGLHNCQPLVIREKDERLFFEELKNDKKRF